MISVVLPLIRTLLPKAPTTRQAWKDALWGKVRPYLFTALFSLIAAALVMAVAGDTITTWRTALLAGYTFDSTLQKFTTGNTATE